MFGNLALLLTALIWGTAFTAQSVGMDYIGPCAFTAARSFIGGIALLPVIALMDGMRLIRQEGVIGLYGLGLRPDAPIDWSLMPHNGTLQTVQWPIAAQESAVHEEVCGYVLSGALPLHIFVTHRLPVESFETGLQLVQQRKGMKIALTF